MACLLINLYKIQIKQQAGKKNNIDAEVRRTKLIN